MAILLSTLNIILLALGFGFVIFFHELGHFLAAKWQRVKVEQFAVGFGPALLAWRKGLGFRYGTTTPEFERRIDAHIEKNSIDAPRVQQVDQAMAELGLSETEYRLNWVPLGGYVKMLGQDDLRPEAVADDPRAYNNKSIGGRMIIVSAGVVMNVILAAIGFMVVFLIGFHVAPAEVGGVISDSPAAAAVTTDGKIRGLAVGDKLLEIDGDKQQDFTKVAESVALSEEGTAIPVKVQHADGTIETLLVTPAHPDKAGKGLLAIGVAPPQDLRGPDADDEEYASLMQNPDCYPAEMLAIKPGDVITEINGQTVVSWDKGDDFWKLAAALTAADGGTVKLMVKDASGASREVDVTPRFQQMFREEDIQFAGMMPRVQVDNILETSQARGQVKPGDVIERIVAEDTNERLIDPRFSKLQEILNDNGQAGHKIYLVVGASGSPTTRQTGAMLPNVDVGIDKKGLGVGLTAETGAAVVADVEADSPAQKAGIQAHSVIAAVGGHAVGNWFQVRRYLLATPMGQPVAVDATLEGQVQHLTMTLTPEAYHGLAEITITSDVVGVLHGRIVVRQTNNPLVAAGWGAVETRDFILQFYLTLKRMLQGSVPAGNAMGPVGIFASGIKIANKGPDWLIWFLSVISANLAVVNFLPIPVVDGGLFTFLLLEKIQGKPLSANAQRIVQMVGIVLILCAFGAVTYNDIANHLFGHS